jgi:hypothetical protein
MKWTKILMIVLFVFLLLFAFGCADSAETVDDEHDEGDDAASEEEYSPDVVDQLSEDIEDIRW